MLYDTIIQILVNMAKVYDMKYFLLITKNVPGEGD